jgi:hypothetical protein
MTPTRRAFVKHAGLATIIASSQAPMFLFADDKPVDKAPILGEGQFKYEAIHGWAKLPDGMRFGNTHMVQEDAQGRIFIHHQGGSGESVCVFDPDGKFIKAWGKEWSGGAHGMQLRKEPEGEFLYLATTGQKKVVKTDLEGKPVFVLDFPKEAMTAEGKPCYDAKNPKYSPTNIAFAPNGGDFYVADGYGSFWVHQYTREGNYVRTFGGPGKADGQLQVPHGIFTDTRDAANPKVLVADRGNERIQYFSLDGKHLQTIKPEGNAFRHPCHFDQRGENLVLPGLHGRVSILDKENRIVAILGDNADATQRGKNPIGPDKRKPGVFVSPHGASYDRAGNIYVTEWVSDGRVIKLRPVA